MTKLSKKIIITGTIITKTGILVGGTNSAMNIGGTDKMVVRNPITNEPYIPGSSLKGKMRSLLELAYGYIKDNGADAKIRFEGQVDPDKYVTALMFGNAPKKTDGNVKQRPSRIIVRDANLNEKSSQHLQDLNLDLPFTEAKTEVVIDRVTAVASPRTFERVPAGAYFDLNLVLNIFDIDAATFDEKTLISNTFKSLQLVQDDYIGGSGSRGYGQVKFEIIEITERPSEYYQGEKDKEVIHDSKEKLTTFGVPADLLKDK
jgi:CRISPR-associated protein Csm3